MDVNMRDQCESAVSVSSVDKQVGSGIDENVERTVSSNHGP
jgi:hypothetical protein